MKLLSVEKTEKTQDTNLGHVGDVVPVWGGEVKLALQDLLKKGLLVVTTAANIG